MTTMVYCTVCGHKRPAITLTAKKAVYTGKPISIDAPTVMLETL
ncbi:MAG: hypothetical protein ACLS54_13920 [Anaerostipes hadrus]